MMGYEQYGDPLTPRELQVVVEYTIHGCYKDVARCMGIAPQTAKNYGSAVCVKTGAVWIAHVPFVLGWVTLPDGERHAA